jgi:hypothetical protein
MPPANPARACSCLCMFERASRQSGRAASAGGHHGGPRRATRRFHPDSPGSGAAPTLCPVAAQMTATKRISDALFPRGFEVASPRRSLESSRKPSSCIRRSMYPRRKKFLFPLKRFFFQPQRNNSRRQQPQRGRWRRGGSTTAAAAAGAARAR